jgi:hypothetical protein
MTKIGKIDQIGLTAMEHRSDWLQVEDSHMANPAKPLHRAHQVHQISYFTCPNRNLDAKDMKFGNF